MNIYKIFLLGLLLIIPYLLTGCGEDDSATQSTETRGIDDSIDLNTTSYTVVLPVNEASIEVGNQVVNIDVTIIDEANNPVTTGKVKIVFPNDVRTGRDVGSFENLSIELDNGIASFTYTAPKNLNENTSDIIFGFYYSENTEDVKNYTFNLNPDPDQIVLNEYELSISIGDGNYIMNLEDTKQIVFHVKDKNGVLVSDDKMTSIEVKLLNVNLGDLQGLSGIVDDNLIILNTNSGSVNILSNTISGTIPISAVATFEDDNGNTQVLSEIINVVILSGPASSMSLSYASTEQDAEYAKFIENWVLTVTDKYNNRVNTQPSISVGMIAGYAKDATTPGNNPHEFVYYNPSSGGTLLNSLPEDIFIANSDVFANVDSENETLVLFGNGYTYDASGKWDFYKDSDSRLNLVDDFDGTTTSNLGFAVGNNYRQDGSYEGVEWVGNVYLKDSNTSRLEDNGMIIIQVEYDYYLTGKDVVLWVNLLGKVHTLDVTTRVGEAKKITPRAQGLTAGSFVVPKGTTVTYTINIGIANTVEMYRHARFIPKVIPSGSVVIDSIVTSNDDIVNNNVAWITVTATNVDLNKDESVTVNAVVANEF